MTVLVQFIHGCLKSNSWFSKDNRPFYNLCKRQLLLQHVLLLACGVRMITPGVRFNVCLILLGDPLPAGHTQLTHSRAKIQNALAPHLGSKAAWTHATLLTHTQPIRGWYPKTFTYRWHISAHSPSTFPYGLGSLLLNIYHPYDIND